LGSTGHGQADPRQIYKYKDILNIKPKNKALFLENRFHLVRKRRCNMLPIDLDIRLVDKIFSLQLRNLSTEEKPYRRKK